MDHLIAKNLRKRYKSNTVVQDVSLKIGQGQIVGLLGPNGAGKTTSFYMIVGLISCDGGSVHLADKDITHYPMHQRARLGLGYLPQETSIFRKMNVSENISAILQLQKSSKKEQKQKLDELLEEFHISHLRDAPAMTLSGGERRRVEIARALATNPKFLLLDEPFAGIDPVSVIDIKGIIKYLSKEKGLGILITDHNAVETLNICEYAYIVNEGNIMAEGTSDVIAKNAEVRDIYLGHEMQILKG